MLGFIHSSKNIEDEQSNEQKLEKKKNKIINKMNQITKQKQRK